MVIEYGTLGTEENWQMVLTVNILLFLLVVISFIIVVKWASQICKIIMVTEIILMMVHNYRGQDKYFYNDLIIKSIKNNKIKRRNWEAYLCVK